MQTRRECKTGLKVSLHFSRSLLYRFSLFRSLLAGLGLDKHFQTLQTLQQHVFLRFSALRVVRLVLSPLFTYWSHIFLAILEGNCTEQDKVELEADGAVEDAALEAKEADCEEKKAAWHLHSHKV